MKSIKNFYIFAIGIICILCSCNSDGIKNHQQRKILSSVKDTTNLNELYIITNVYRVDTDGKKHEYILYENTSTKRRDCYAFYLEHKINCKACLDMFD